MEKIKNALKSVNKFGLLALVLVAFATLSFTTVKKDMAVQWGLDGSTWVKVTGEYECINSGICTRLYPEGQDPNINPSGYTDQEPGTFVQ